ncbi:MAG: tRNA (N(6)-L-threonylcarbamoyladenosine(37)-C(2))-methylthiotransferase MtaB [Candidatus Zixiibacteriota bacterium]
MKKVAFDTVGCRLNQYDTEQIAAKMQKRGFCRVPMTEPADIYIINTCTVTGRADASCRNIISRTSRQFGSSPVVVIGCYVESDPQKVAQLNGVDLIINNREKERIIDILSEKYPQLFETESIETSYEHISEFHDHNRAWIKIGDGCNQRCSYCIIPDVRGPLINRDPNEIIEEIRALAANEYQEVVLTGIHIGQYHIGAIDSLPMLLTKIIDETDIYRVRLSSIEPQEVNTELLDVVRNNGQRVCRHFHIPLQSGSDRILKLMHRPYNRKKYLEIIGNVKNRIDGVVVGSDIIVGFPGETDEDFSESVKVAQSGLLDYLHVFSYSDRPGTEASQMADKINPQTIKERNAILREISEQLYTRALECEIGRTDEVISEHRAIDKNQYRAIADNYLSFLLPEGIGGGKQVIKIRALEMADGYLSGEIV